jgi:hypothetical protein
VGGTTGLGFHVNGRLVNIGAFYAYRGDKRVGVLRVARRALDTGAAGRLMRCAASVVVCVAVTCWTGG